MQSKKTKKTNYSPSQATPYLMQKCPDQKPPRNIHGSKLSTTLQETTVAGHANSGDLKTKNRLRISKCRLFLHVLLLSAWLPVGAREAPLR